MASTICTVVGLLFDFVGVVVLAVSQSVFASTMKEWVVASMQSGSGPSLPILQHRPMPFTVEYYTALSVLGWGLIFLGMTVQTATALLNRGRTD